MYIRVKLLSGLPTPLWYSVPMHLQQSGITVGTIVQVPLRNTCIPAYVLSYTISIPTHLFAIKDIAGIEKLPKDIYYIIFLEELSRLYSMPHTWFIARLQQFLHQKDQKSERLVVSNNNTHKQTALLTNEQQKVCSVIFEYIEKSVFKPALLHGVTGSGKTEVYKRLISYTLAQNKTVILLLPEVTLAVAFEERLRTELGPNTPLFGFHSGKTKHQKQALWNQLLLENPVLIIGVHLPILLPIANLGLIIIDEEHDTGYQEKRHPKINSKQAALLRARHTNIPILFGSATPAISTLYKVKKEKWLFFQLKERFGGAFPTITTILLPTNKHRRKHFWISKELEEAIAERIAKKEQTIIFLNRRGHSFFVQCTICSFIFNCPHCSVSLTLHDHNILTCHYCGLSSALPQTCTHCKAPQEKLLKKGIGTQQAVTLLHQLFPTARIARADMDTTRKKTEWHKTVTQFTNGTIDILVGTQTVTKGYHFPKVTLVGIMWADLNIHFPQFNAAEITLQQLIQVAGRAGRSSMESAVIVQSMAHHPIFNYLNEIDYLQLYAPEMASRTALCYPPYYQLVEIELKHANDSILEREAHHLATRLITLAQPDTTITILGPAKPLIHKIQNMYARTIFIKSAQIDSAVRLFGNINTKEYKSKIFFTPIF